jgi:PhzF family phenazine biosynthesis protein
MTVQGRPFTQVDVFAPGPLPGNPLAVVHEADGLTTAQMQTFANWTNLSETAFLLQPGDPEADYRVRIFTPKTELPFAGHPTLGAAHAWLERGGVPRNADRLVQACGAGLVPVRRDGDVLAFAAPPLVRSGPVADETLAQVAASLRIAPGAIVRSQWIDNGPGWLGVQVATAAEVLALEPDFVTMGDLAIGVIGAHGAGGPADFEVRAFAPAHNISEDPVTGSVNAGLALWLTRERVTDGTYVVRQGTALGRGGQVLMSLDAEGVQWVGGVSRSVIRGMVDIT